MSAVGSTRLEKIGCPFFSRAIKTTTNASRASNAIPKTAPTAMPAVSPSLRLSELLPGGGEGDGEGDGGGGERVG